MQGLRRGTTANHFWPVNPIESCVVGDLLNQGRRHGLARENSRKRLKSPCGARPKPPGNLNQIRPIFRSLLKVLFITGYAENASSNHGHLEPGMQMMTKPFAG